MTVGQRPERSSYEVATIVPTYGPAPYLSETLASLESQTVAPHEVIVVDDGSTPQVEVPSTRLPIRLLRIDHAGIAGARNAGLEATTAPLVHICDHDDLVERRFYERVVDAFAAHRSVDVVHATCGFIDEEGARLSWVLPGSPPDYRTTGATVRTFLRMNPIASVATVFRRDVAERLGGFQSLDFVQDWDFWLRAASQDATFGHVGEVLAWHRVHADQQSAPEKTPSILAESRRMLRAQDVPPREWATRERTIADLHLAEATHHASVTGRLAAACIHVARAVPVRPLAALRAIVNLRSW